jgi:lysophospholipase L1-like esterase
MRLLTAAIPVLLLGAAVTTPTSAAAAGAPQPSYYLSLGDSLAQGVQPLGSGGADIVTDHGYADDIYKALRVESPGLQLEKLGCPGETSATMIAGGICAYAPYTSQLQAAVAFLQAHSGHIALVTVDIGANDVDSCVTTAGINETCLAAGLTSAADNLPVIVGTLRSAAPNVRIVGMTYYDPFLAAWLLGSSGQALAATSLTITDQFNGVLSADYGAGHILVAPVADAFRTATSTPLPIIGIPTNVSMICGLTWMCVPAPEGPNVHANDAGYAIIAGAFLWRIPLLATR